MEVTVLHWEFAHMELHLSEHLTALLLAVLPLHRPTQLHILVGLPAPKPQKSLQQRVSASTEDPAVKGRKFVLRTH